MTDQQLINTSILVNELRSGKYRQGKNQLRINNTFCWTGVACDIFNNTFWCREEYDNGYIEESYKGERFVMPDEIKEFYGFSSPIGEFIGDPWSLESLSDMNDGGCDFNIIANTIEWGLKNKESEMFI